MFPSTAEVHSLRAFENRVLRIYKWKREEITAGLKKLNGELRKLHSSINTIRAINQAEWY
jgi:prefoldin subunit 5